MPKPTHFRRIAKRRFETRRTRQVSFNSFPGSLRAGTRWLELHSTAESIGKFIQDLFRNEPLPSRPVNGVSTSILPVTYENFPQQEVLIVSASINSFDGSPPLAFRRLYNAS